jgi:hypothetical protein
MENIKIPLNNGNFSPETLKKIASKITEKGV